jgi:UDP-3-O-[3-hydroxymyristoyl] glucosamine N-acyltransferase
MKLGEIAHRLGCTLEGSDSVEITGVAGLEEAGEGELTFLSNPKYHRKALETKASAILATSDFKAPGRTVLYTANPYLAFARAIEIFHPAPPPPAGIHPTAVIAPTAKIGTGASIAPYVVVEDEVVIGKDCVLRSFVVIGRGAFIGDRFLAHAHAVVREGVRIGNDVILQNGVVVGSDGFGFARQEDGSYYKIIQSGTAVIEDGVEVQSNSCIDRASVGETRIRRGVKVDNLVQVGHGCDIGENTLLCGQVGLAGSSKTGRNVILAGQVGIAGHLTIGDRVIIGAQSGIHSDIPSGKILAGSPAIDNHLWMKCVSAYSRLPEMFSLLRKMKAHLQKTGVEL